MIHTSINHHIQKHILDLLSRHKVARFRDLRPPRVDTNLFTYHLGILVKSGYIHKSEAGYSLSLPGLIYVDRVSKTNREIRPQPKIVTMFVVQNTDGDLLLQRRTKQPFIESWTLPHGKLHLEDVSLLEAAEREISEKMGVSEMEPIHAGDCYIRVHADDMTLVTLAHVFRFTCDTVKTGEALMWARPHKLQSLPLAPAVEEIATRTFFQDPFFFEEFTVQWHDND